MTGPRAVVLVGILLAGCAGLEGLTGGAADGSAPVDAGAEELAAPTPEGGAPRDGTVADVDAGGSITDAGPTCDANLKVDPNNCGRCGHGCLGGDCVASVCAPFVLTTPPTGEGVNEALAVNGDKIYWTNFGGGTVWALPIAGGGAQALQASGIDTPVGIYFRGGQMLVTSYQSGIFGVAGGIDAGLQTIASGLGTAGCLTLDSIGIAYTTDFMGGRVLRIGPGDVVAAITSNQDLPWGVAVDDTYIYWSNLGTNTLYRAKLDGTGQTTLAAAEHGQGCLAIDADYLYWPADDQGLRRMPRDGGTPETIGVGKAYLGVAVDAVSYYYTDNGRLMRLAR